jgi:hypothetical protein
MYNSMMQVEYGEPVPQAEIDKVPPDFNEVGEHDWQWSDGKLMTVGAFTCIVVAAHSSVTQEGLLGHFSAVAPIHHVGSSWHCDLSREHTDIDKFKAAMDAVPRLGPPAKTGIWIGGGIIGQRDEDEVFEWYANVMRDRNHVLHVVKKLIARRGISRHNVITDWNNSQNGIRVGLDCPQGLVTVRPEIDI